MTDMSPLLPLEGGFNLRDMGGYATADGRRVRRGLLFRSGLMSMLTEADEARLAALGIATVCDLRRPVERRRDPTRWCEPAGVLYWARDHDASSGVLGELLSGALPTADGVRAAMISVYREILIDHAPSYRFLFDRLAGGHVPLLFNCSAGKDRTGVGAALILSALGVPRETIYEDYLLTNRFADFSRIVGRVDPDRYRNIDADVLAPLLAADADYLDTAFDSLDRDHGGIDAYLASIGVDDAVKVRLRELLLD
ncbi:tyrosine-protein phosphatase [Rhizorhabdus sp.]|jgi:protein-tyrosine phosphatase|uniref:tyrosine-protein phosphatase n=1 Tax=Rhizorhabdus sp. TaxID=1968843 RepID=UPI0012180A07|nr:tyrosine-protein phosphatase [Rhizorhabdus sp.]MBD3759777.1 tyrosine-protein phosphatase [Rhizorhabdus sp.]TAK17160.1 MAG: tyrosine-protein phosphatase [Rhizorhabdus sp.]